MANLLQETLEAIKASGHTSDQIVFIGSQRSGHSCSWAEFEALADVEYNAGFGSSQVAIDLIIVFSDGQKMWRGEYDGSEWWEYGTPFVPPRESKPILSLMAPESRVGWCSLAEIHK